MTYGYIPLEDNARRDYDDACKRGDDEGADRLAHFISQLKEWTDEERLEYLLGEPCAGWSCDD